MGRVAVHAVKSPTKVANLGNKTRVVGQNMANSVEIGTPWSIQAGIADKVGRQV